jgi:HemY protein
MKYLLWTLGLFAAAVAFDIAAHNPGYVLFVYPPYRIELSLMLFVMLSLATFALSYGLVRLSVTVMRLPDQVRKYRLKSEQAKKSEVLEAVLAAFFEGRYAAAEKAASQAMESGGSSALYPIIAARSAHELRDYKKRDAYLMAAENRTIGDTTMKLMTASKFMLDQHNPVAALNALRQLRDTGVKGHVGAMSLELKAQQQAGNWDEVLKVLDRLERRTSIDALMAEQLRQQAWLEKIRQQKDLDGLVRCLREIPGNLKLAAKIAGAAARGLINVGGGEIAEKLVSESLDARWDSELALLYGDCISGDVLSQIEKAEKWLVQHNQDQDLLLALGKLCVHQKLWGKAQIYLDASISIAPSQEAYTVLAQLSERLGKSEQAFNYYHRAMSLAK